MESIQDAIDLIDVFGTHYASQLCIKFEIIQIWLFLVMGSQFIIENEFNQSSYNFLVNEGYDLFAAASTCYKNSTSGINSTDSWSENILQTFDGN